MKKYVNPLPVGGTPLRNEDLIRMSEEPLNAINAIVGGLKEPVVLTGCESTVNGSNVTVTEGYVYLNGEVMKFNGYNGLYPFYIVEDTAAYTQYTFQDGATRNALIERKATTSTVQPSTLDFILFNPTSSKTFKKSIVGTVAADLTQEITDRTNAVTTINTTLASKVDKFTPNWQRPTDLRAGMTMDWSGDTVGFMKDSMGFVHIRGSITTGGLTGSVFTLPTGFRPSTYLRYGNRSISNLAFAFVDIATTGLLSISSDASTTFHLNGIIFYVG